MDPEAEDDVAGEDVDAEENRVGPLPGLDVDWITAHSDGAEVRDQEEREDGVDEELENLEDEDDPEARLDHPGADRDEREDDDQRGDEIDEARVGLQLGRQYRLFGQLEDVDRHEQHEDAGRSYLEAQAVREQPADYCRVPR